ncbi:hypothetical protein LINPERPRIM_LOCUS4236 [Linum perenne]
MAPWFAIRKQIVKTFVLMDHVVLITNVFAFLQVLNFN